MNIKINPRIHRTDFLKNTFLKCIKTKKKKWVLHPYIIISQYYRILKAKQPHPNLMCLLISQASLS